MKKNTSIILILVTVALAIGTYITSKNKQMAKTPTSTETMPAETAPTTQIPNTDPAVTNPETPVSTPTQTTPEPTAQTSNTFTLAQVATHKTEADCYTAVNGMVYNVTAWINKHPGGSREILRICGIDGSAAFNGQYRGDIKVENILGGFEIGTLVK